MGKVSKLIDEIQVRIEGDVMARFQGILAAVCEEEIGFGAEEIGAGNVEPDVELRYAIPVALSHLFAAQAACLRAESLNVAGGDYLTEQQMKDLGTELLQPVITLIDGFRDPNGPKCGPECPNCHPEMLN